jgi:beta-glucosidase
MALRAGMDMELPRTIAYGEPLARALDEGLVDEQTLDLSVARVLRVKFEMGLFDDAPDPDPGAAVIDPGPERELALRLARESMVLLENDGTLPLATDMSRLAVIGPGADDPRNLIGDYAHQLHIDTILDQSETIATGTPVADSVHHISPSDDYPTVLSELRDRLEHTEVVHAPGGTLWDAPDEDIASATRAAAAADVAVLVLGERSGLTDDAISGEARDRMDIGLPFRQDELLEAVVATGTPVVLVLIAGRPLSIPWAAENCAAIVHAWVPGERGAEAIVDVLTGVVNPGGKLPITVPRHSGQIPTYYGHRPTGGHSNWKDEYVDGSNLPLWPFGFGRSYTTFELSDLRLSAARIPAHGQVEVSVDVADTGDRAGDEVVQLYVRDVAASLTRPVKELRGFVRLSLEPGERRTVTFTLDAEALAFVDVPGRWLVEPGDFRLMVGTSSADLPLEAGLTVVGTARHIEARSHFLTPVAVR